MTTATVTKPPSPVAGNLTLGRVLRTRLGLLVLPRSLVRSHWRELTAEELEALMRPGASR